MAYLSIGFSFAAIVLAAKLERLVWWERAGMACVALALLIQGVQARAPQTPTLGTGAVPNIGRWLLFTAIGLGLLSLARHVWTRAHADTEESPRGS